MPKQRRQKAFLDCLVLKSADVTGPLTARIAVGAKLAFMGRVEKIVTNDKIKHETSRRYGWTTASVEKQAPKDR